MVKRLIRILILLLSLSHLTVACQGTETGNPGNAPGVCPTLTAVKGATGSDETLDDLILAICQRVVACGISTTIDGCVNALNGEDGNLMTDEFGRPDGTTVDQLRADLISDAVTAVASAVATCEEDVDAVACSDVTSNVSAGDFSGVENLIPASCIDVFLTNPDSSSSPGCP